MELRPTPRTARGARDVRPRWDSDTSRPAHSAIVPVANPAACDVRSDGACHALAAIVPAPPTARLVNHTSGVCPEDGLIAAPFLQAPRTTRCVSRPWET